MLYRNYVLKVCFSIFMGKSNWNIDQNSIFSQSINCNKKIFKIELSNPRPKPFESKSFPLWHWFRPVLWPIWINNFVRWSRKKLLCLNLMLWYWDSVNKPYRSIPFRCKSILMLTICRKLTDIYIIMRTTICNHFSSTAFTTSCRFRRSPFSLCRTK